MISILNTEWLFFDMGSTLIDEKQAYIHRIEDTVKNSSITFKQFYNTMTEFYCKNQKGDYETAKFYNLKLGNWCIEDEVLYPYTAGCLEKLHYKYKIGIIANQNPGAKDRLNDFGILQYIDLVVSSAEEGISKPDNRIFESALNRAGCKAENAVMIGDRIDNDIVPAKRLGMKTIWVRQGLWGLSVPLNSEETADFIVDSLYDILKILI